MEKGRVNSIFSFFFRSIYIRETRWGGFVFCLLWLRQGLKLFIRAKERLFPLLFLPKLFAESAKSVLQETTGNRRLCICFIYRLIFAKCPSFFLSSTSSLPGKKGDINLFLFLSFEWLTPPLPKSFMGIEGNKTIAATTSSPFLGTCESSPSCCFDFCLSIRGIGAM